MAYHARPDARPQYTLRIEKDQRENAVFPHFVTSFHEKIRIAVIRTWFSRGEHSPSGRRSRLLTEGWRA